MSGVIVTQADRRAAAPWMGFAYHAAIAGQADMDTLVEAFARHREEAVREMVKAIEELVEGFAEGSEYELVQGGYTPNEARKLCSARALLSRYSQRGQEEEVGRPGASLGQPCHSAEPEPVPVSALSGECQAQGAGE
jgi:hypothetical protein